MDERTRPSRTAVLVAEAPTFFGWHDPSKKYPPATKLADAVDAYRERHGRFPRVALVNPVEADELARSTLATDEVGLEVRALAILAPGTYYLGIESGGAGVAVDTADAS